MNLAWHCVRSRRSLEQIKNMSTVFNNLKDVKEARLDKSARKIYTAELLLRKLVN